MLVGPYVNRIAQEAQKVNLSFVHAGHLYCPDTLIDELAVALNRSGRKAAVVSIGDVHQQDDLEGELVIGGFKELLHGRRERRQRGLANARESLMRQLKGGDLKGAIMISDVPKSVLLTNPGSQLAQDGRPIEIRPLSQEELTHELSGSGLEEAEISHVAEWSGGLPRLAQALLESLSGDRNETIRRSRTAFAENFKAALGELDVFSLATLEDWMIGTDGVVKPLVENDPLLQEALIGSGVMTREVDGSDLTFTVPRAGMIWREAFQDALAGDLRDDENVGELSLLLWRLERRLRALLRQSALERHGQSWRSDMLKSLPDSSMLPQDLVRRYQGEALVQVEGVEEVPNPCDWLTLDEVLRLLESRTGDESLTRTSAFWRRLREEVVPIRNRTAHSRLPKKRDKEKVTGWLARLA